jgi:BarA-like signal transduction histidine kinase
MAKPTRCLIRQRLETAAKMAHNIWQARPRKASLTAAKTYQDYLNRVKSRQALRLILASIITRLECDNTPDDYNLYTSLYNIFTL